VSKVIRRKLARGVELLYQWIFTPLVEMAAGFSASINVEQLQKPKAPFRVNLNIPHISARYFMHNPGAMFYVPFALPPLQEHFTAAGVVPAGTPTPTLVGVGFSFDQRGEAAHLSDRWQYRTPAQSAPDQNFVSSPFEGSLQYDRALSIDIKVVLYEKSQHYFVTQSAGSGSNDTAQFAEGPQREVWSTTVPASLLTNSAYRLNPNEFSGLAEAIDPKKTYIIGINADGLYDADGGVHCSLCSFQLSLRFKMELTERDRSAQNQPAHNGARTGETISITSPVQSGVIAADTAAGVSTNMEKIDSRLRHKLWGGYSHFSDTYPYQQLLDDAAYEVIAVPMFGNTCLGEILAEPSWGQLNGVLNQAGNSYARTYCDRLVVPITSPMTVHHVLATNNFTSATGYQHSPGPKFPWHPDYGDWMLEVGVGVLSGPQADNLDYQQIAYGEFTPGYSGSAFDSDMVDFMDLRTPALHQRQTDVYAPWYEQALFAVPISGTGGAGYATQGTPVFVGEAARGAVSTWQRSQTGGAGNTAAGQDQLLEIRMRINATAGGDIYNSAGAFQAANWGSWDVFSGYGGCWVYIIGKKHLRS
jgi:hypothetical protein